MHSIEQRRETILKITSAVLERQKTILLEIAH